MLKKYLLLLTCFVALFGAAWGLIMYLFIPSWWYAAYPIVPAFFYLLGLGEAYLTRKSEAQTHRTMLNRLLIQRVIRWGLILVILVLLLVFSRPPRISFLVSFMMLYMNYTILDMWRFSRMTKKKK